MIFSKLPPAPLGAGFFCANALKAVAKGAGVRCPSERENSSVKALSRFFEQGRAIRARYLTKAQAVTAPTSEAMSATGTA